MLPIRARWATRKILYISRYKDNEKSAVYCGTCGEYCGSLLHIAATIIHGVGFFIKFKKI